jgi:serine/threonine protein phosphatase 1
MTTQTIAIGDVHGSYSALLQVIEPLIDSGAELIFLGDLFDRSPELDGDRKVCELIYEMCLFPELYGLSNVEVLMGNHEQLMIEAWLTDDYELWEMNGGNRQFLEWLESEPLMFTWLMCLPLYLVRGHYLLVHAGVKPDVSLADQSPEDLIWHRPKPNERHGLPYLVIHGHTIHQNVTEYYDRIAIDTGAFHTGKLSTYSL